jgi:hypothetical protein
MNLIGSTGATHKEVADMLYVKANLSKDQMWDLPDKVEHDLSQACSVPLCPCSTPETKAIIKASEMYAHNHGQKN